MPDYDLSGLSNRSFEQLIQALATKVLGPGTVLFGDGPDGGREAVFEGSVPFPADEDPWTGYIVVQAKFRQTPKGGQQDWKWLVDQAANEFKKYGKRKTQVRVPEYYILATNVFLSAVAEVGGKDRCTTHLAELTKRLGICYEEPLRNHYEDSLRQVVRMDAPFSGPAWALLFGLARRRIGWAEALADENWPQEQSAVTTLVRMACVSLSDENVPEKWLQRVVTALPQVSPENAFRFRRPEPAMAKLPAPRWFLDATSLPRVGMPGRTLRLSLSLEREKAVHRFNANLTPVQASGELPLALTEMPSPNQAWRSIIAVMEFLSAPDISTLAAALEQIASSFHESRNLIGYFNPPWPLVSILDFSSSAEELRGFSKRVEAREFGDIQEWLIAEERWVSKGASEDDLLWVTRADIPFDATIVRCGVPYGALFIVDSDERTLMQLIAVFRKMPDGPHRSCFGRMILYNWVNSLRRGHSGRLPNDVIRELLIMHRSEYISLDFFMMCEDLGTLIELDADVVEKSISGSSFLYAMSFGPHGGWDREARQEVMDTLCRLYSSDRHGRRWLLRPIAALALSGIDLSAPVETDGSHLGDAETAAAMILKVIQGHFDARDASVLSRRAVREELENIGVRTGGWRRSGAVQDSAVVGEFLHALWAATEADEYVLRDSIVDALNDLIGRRKSGLLSRDVWESMGLPQSLREVGVAARQRAASHDTKAAR